MKLADLEHSVEDGIVLARIRGEVDMSNAADLRDELIKLTTNQALALILDLTDVEYLDSAGIQLIYRLRENVAMRGQGFRLVIPDASPVLDALRLAGLAVGTDTVATSQEARQSFDATRPRTPSE